MKNLSKYALALGAVALAMVPEVAHAAFAPGFSAASGTDIAGQITQMANQTSGTPALVSWGAEHRPMLDSQPMASVVCTCESRFTSCSRSLENTT